MWNKVKGTQEIDLSRILLIAILLVLTSCASEDDQVIEPETDPISTDCSGTTSTFTINLNPADCTVDIQAALGANSQYSEAVNGSSRSITINSIASHLVGIFPNGGNPNAISVQNSSFTISTQPTEASNSTSAQGYDIGVLFSGVSIDPFTAEYFRTSTGGFNRDWNITTLTSTVDLGLDCNNAHVQPTGKYHYHGTPSAYTEDLDSDGTKMVKIGYAADGFPIYHKYGYADDGTTIVEFQSGYQLKVGSRPGNGSSAPDGCYDGTYFQDYEYVSGSELDECNGRFGRTPEVVDGEYYYVMTDNFPSSPLCFTGTPDASFRKGPN